MKTVLASLAVVAALASSAFASSEPRCWYGQNAPACVASQGTNATRFGDEKAKSVKDDGVHETDHNRDTTSPF